MSTRTTAEDRPGSARASSNPATTVCTGRARCRRISTVRCRRISTVRCFRACDLPRHFLSIRERICRGDSRQRGSLCLCDVQQRVLGQRRQLYCGPRVEGENRRIESIRLDLLPRRRRNARFRVGAPISLFGDVRGGFRSLPESKSARINWTRDCYWAPKAAVRALETADSLGFCPSAQ
jgi:hypothetical protein